MRLFLLLILLCFTAKADRILAARVIYAEAGPQCLSYERYLVAKVINNRVKHKYFPNTLEKVLKQKNAFSVLNDWRNQNWKDSYHLSFENDLSDKKNNAFSEAYKYVSSVSKTDKFSEITMFHSKDISPPSHYYNNKYWRLILVRETKNFKFYKLKKK